MERIFRTPTTVAATDINTIPTPSKQAPLVAARFPRKLLSIAPVIGAFASIGLGGGHFSVPSVVNYGGSLVDDNNLLGLSGLLTSTAKF